MVQAPDLSPQLPKKNSFINLLSGEQNIEFTMVGWERFVLLKQFTSLFSRQPAIIREAHGTKTTVSQSTPLCTFILDPVEQCAVHGLEHVE